MFALKHCNGDYCTKALQKMNYVVQSSLPNPVLYDLCCAPSTKAVKEDLNPSYGTDFEEASSVAGVARAIVFIRFFNMIHDVTKN